MGIYCGSIPNDWPYTHFEIQIKGAPGGFMNDYNFEAFLGDLKSGREIHFIYKNEQYYIGCGTGYFMFWRFHDAASEIKGEDAEDLLQKVQFDGKRIKELWDLIEINDVF